MSANTDRIANIERLRGLAALAVVICHIAGHYYGFTRVSPGPEKLYAWIGQAGVAVFFVISGFCIRLPEARALAAGGPIRLDVRDYLVRRFLRIAPPYWLALVASIAAGVLAKTELIDGARGPVDILAHLFMVHTLWAPTFNSANAVFWTIGLEAHFYLAYLLFANRPARVWTAVALLVLGLVVFGAASALIAADSPWRIVAQTVFLTSFWQWYLGSLIADWWIKGPRTAPAAPLWMARKVAVILTLLLGLVDPRVAGLHLNSWVLPFAAAAIVALFVVRPVGLGADLGRLRPLNWLGRASYSLYLFHPVALSLTVYAMAGQPVWAASLACLVLALLLAAASYGWVERPLLQWRARRGAAGLRGASGVVEGPALGA